MSEQIPENDFLETQYVYVDTQAFRKARFDWNGKILSRLGQFAQDGHVRLLITEITKREVCDQLLELLGDAANAARKHEVLFGQLGAPDIAQRSSDTSAFERIKDAFEAFLKRTKAIEVPIAVDLSQTLSDYFEHRPPFSQKKKYEFPDAFVLASLKAWCVKRGARAYAISEDPDFVNSCPSDGPLILVSSIAEVVSRATVSKGLHDALVKTLTESEPLSISLSSELFGTPVVRGDRRMPDFWGTVAKVDGIDIESVDVLDRQGSLFTCEIEFGASLSADLELIDSGAYDDPYYSRSRDNIRVSIYRSFYAEVMVVFDPSKPEEFDVQSVHAGKQEIDLQLNELYH